MSVLAQHNLSFYLQLLAKNFYFGRNFSSWKLKAVDVNVCFSIPKEHILLNQLYLFLRMAWALFVNFDLAKSPVNGSDYWHRITILPYTLKVLYISPRLSHPTPETSNPSVRPLPSVHIHLRWSFHHRKVLYTSLHHRIQWIWIGTSRTQILFTCSAKGRAPLLIQR